MTFLRIGWAWACVLLVGAIEARGVGLVIEVTPAKISRRTFDPQNPPPDMPKLTPPEAGTCVYEFGCETATEATGMRGPGVTSPARVTSVRIRTQLTVTLWTPRGASAKLLAHEEAHRAISELYYRPAEAIARRIGGAVLGKLLTVSLANERASQAALDRLQDRLIAEFLRETATRCRVAQDRFDEITAHSLNPIEESAAMAQAVDDERRRFGETSAPAPATVKPSAPGRRSPPTRPGAAPRATP